MQRIDITNCLIFEQGAAKFERIDRNPKTGVEAWRRSYLFEPWRNCIEVFTRDGGKFYPEAHKVARRFPDNPQKWDRIDFYLQNGIGSDTWYPGDKPEGYYNGDNED